MFSCNDKILVLVLVLLHLVDSQHVLRSRSPEIGPSQQVSLTCKRNTACKHRRWVCETHGRPPQQKRAHGCMHALEVTVCVEEGPHALQKSQISCCANQEKEGSNLVSCGDKKENTNMQGIVYQNTISCILFTYKRCVGFQIKTKKHDLQLIRGTVQDKKMRHNIHMAHIQALLSV